MPTLEERRSETTEELEERLAERTYDLRISMEFARYVESMEVYFLELERRLKAIEGALAQREGDRELPPKPRISVVPGGRDSAGGRVEERRQWR